MEVSFRVSSLDVMYVLIQQSSVATDTDCIGTFMYIKLPIRSMSHRETHYTHMKHSLQLKCVNTLILSFKENNNDLSYC
jgi:hypothetical protein